MFMYSVTAKKEDLLYTYDTQKLRTPLLMVIHTIMNSFYTWGNFGIATDAVSQVMS